MSARDRPGRAARRGAEPDPDAAELAHRMVDLARSGDDDLLGHLTAGVPADLTDDRGNTLLVLAAYHGHAALVTALAARGADVDRLDHRGRSPLSGAVFTGEVDVVRALVAAGADPDLGSPSARATAALFERPDLSRLLG